ncbi:O-antigen ligase family protein [Arenimonas composti]|uniref:O-antigen ligase-related domain-containing protein n=1 Tax=Arenimonas composti TR7-09 = DSM 18010 TaxID=1121013 RepID=A0A091BXU1_9GAMM|nr:O-antigen ligase family protein [Arenimonas composti]KFN49175.1 hypothetical protein P873_12020 [Arenimonas composti TR7-09 = DSM 18010]
MTDSPHADRPLRWAPGWVLAFVALWPLPGPAEGVAALGAIAAVAVLLLRRFRGGTALLSQEAWALTAVLFLGYWLPQAVAAIDAGQPARALRGAAFDLKFLPFLWLGAAAVAHAQGRRIVFQGLALLAGLWTLDALLQALLGHSLLFAALDAGVTAVQGRSACAADEVNLRGYVAGIFGPCNPKLGLVLAALAPFAIVAAARRWGVGGWWVSAVAIGIAVLLAGSRAAWIAYAIVLALSGWKLLGGRQLLLAFAVGAGALFALGAASPELRERLERTALALEADGAGVDAALSGRTRVWAAASCMALSHPFNGVGVRGFRDAFPACDPEPGAPLAWGEGPAHHAHQIVLEIASETGAFGLLMWLAAAALAWRAWRFADAAARERARPAMISLVATVFPLNTHLAVYSTFWGGVVMLVAALYAGSLLAVDRDVAAETGGRPAPPR